jgi:hypothetical protein
VGAEEGIDGVGQAATFTDFLKQAGAHVAAEDHVENPTAVTSFIYQGRTPGSQAKMHLLKILGIHGEAGIDGRRGAFDRIGRS